MKTAIYTLEEGVLWETTWAMDKKPINAIMQHKRCGGGQSACV